MNQRNKKSNRNKKRVVKVAGILILAMVLLFQFTNTAKSQEITNYDKVIVCSGDTLWTIASQYIEENQDIRKMIYDIKKLNNLSSAIISPGQELLVPCDSE